MNLRNWAGQHPDDLIKQESGFQAIKELRKVAEREIQDANSVFSSEGKLGHSHNAVIAIASAGLLLEGYRIRKGSPSHHYRMIESLEFTLKLKEEDVKELQDYRRKRSLSIYEQSGLVTEKESAGALKAAKRLMVILNERLSGK